MDDVVEVTDAARMRALGHPLRLRIWRELGPEGATVSQLAHRLPTHKGNAAHHLRVLVDAGLVRPGRSRTVRGGTEQYYVRTARRLRFEGGEEGAATGALLESVAADLSRARGRPLLNHRSVRLTRRQALALAHHLDHVVTELEPAAPGEPTHGVLVGVYELRGPAR